MIKRTVKGGQLRIENLDEQVSLVGWVAKKRNLGGLVFIDLRDRYGVTQIVCKEEFSEITSKIRNEYVIGVKGVVVKRETANPNLPTGEIEVVASELEIINVAETTPLIIADETDALEDTRLKYRYLDLRRPVMQDKLITRHKITRSVREYLDGLDFVDVETPLLGKSTPEGARDYLVPSRVNPGKFYALPQSPQLFKQLLMVSGLERYYQIARCFRDEDLRSDRQPDFTQIDIETSFLSEEEIKSLCEGLYVKMLKDVKNYDLKAPFKNYSFKEVMNRFGSDKPDTRFGYELKDLTHVFKENENALFTGVYAENGCFKGINIEEKATEITRKEIDRLTSLVKKYRAKHLLWARVTEEGIEGSMAKLLSEAEVKEMVNVLEGKPGDMLFVIGDKYWETVCNSLGALRSDAGKKYRKHMMVGFDLLWVVDFPLFEYNIDEGTYDSTHHPFTRPYDEDVQFLDTDPSKVRAHHYDLVMNGYELGSGSLRIYDQEMQKKVFNIIGLTDEEIEKKFGFFINAFKYGTPPHGGIAFGLDRIAMILTESESIRDVIAFPKNASAVCPMSEAPTPATEKQLADLSIKVVVNE